MFADDMYMAHIVLSEDGNEVLLATDMYGNFLP